MEIQWTDQIPTVPGLYWFYGDDQWGQMCQPPSKFHPELHVVKVHRIRNGYMYVAEGNFMFGGHGLWSAQPIEEPKVWPEMVSLPTTNG